MKGPVVSTIVPLLNVKKSFRCEKGTENPLCHPGHVICKVARVLLVVDINRSKK